MSLATDTIYRNTFKSKRYTLQRQRRSYIVVMQKQKLHHFCNRFSPDDDSKLGRKYLGYIQLYILYWDIYNYGKYINQFPPNMIKAIRTDQEENM